MENTNDIPEFPEADDVTCRTRELEILQEAIGRAPIRSLRRILQSRAFLVAEREGVFWSELAGGLARAEQLLAMLAQQAATSSIVDLCSRCDSEPWIAIPFHVRAAAQYHESVGMNDLAAAMLGLADSIDESSRGLAIVLGELRAAIAKAC